MSQLDLLLSNYSTSNTQVVCCLVFFSPSGVDAVCSMPNLVKSLTTSSSNLKIHLISIGPSTTQRLRQLNTNSNIYELNKPSPQALYEKLKEII